MYLENIQPLVVTPSVKKGESIWGYLLRASDLNGYETPIDFLRYAGLTESESRNIQVPIKKLENLFLENSEKLSKTSYSLSDIKSSDYKKRVHKFMGYKVPSQYINAKGMKICPECIKEKGYIDSFWDLIYAVGCDVHKRKLITKCPNCNKNISRYRKGMLICSCGHDLSNEKGDVIESEELILLLRFMKSKTYRKKIDNNRYKNVDFPLEHLKKINIVTLLSLIWRFTYNYSYATGVKKENRYDSMLRAAYIFSNWPNGFYGYMAGLGKNLVSKGRVFASYRRQFLGFNNSLKSKSLPAKEVKFIYDEFINYGLNHWKTAVVDKRMCKEFSGERTIVGINGLAERLRVRPSKAKHLVELGVIKVVNHPMSKSVKYLFDLSYKLPFKDGKGSSVSARDSAKYLCLPVSVLNKLREDGVYSINYIPAKMKSYHQMDLDRLKKKYC